MARTIKYENSNGDIMTLGEGPSFYLFDLRGFDGLQSIIATESGPDQNGSTYIRTSIKERDLSFVIVVLGSNVVDAETKRREVLKLFNPTLGQGTLTYYNGSIEKQIVTAIELAPTMPKGEMNKGNKIKLRMLVKLVSPQPFFEDIDESVIELAEVEPLFVFPLILPTDIGDLSTDTAIVDNIGDVETPVTIEIPEGIEDPIVTNVTTGFFMKVNTTIPADKTMIITTDFDNKRVVLRDNITGVETNASQFVDFTSDYFQLVLGENELNFEATSGDAGAILVIRYKNRFIGL